MASSHVAFLAISMVLLCSVATAVDHVVGDESGWTLNFDYTKWAQDKVFNVGDNLVFKYNVNNHNLVKVDGATFKNCTNIPQGNEVLRSGNDVIPLGTPGRKWYICAVSDHCSRGMKLAITVQYDGPAPAPSAAPALPSSIYGVFVAAMVAIAAIFV
ncbi:hypothetical protein L6164_004797 [Bauhinia variegata]|uniref:Uncharacterized protein n=1 Tax=Bauhinia variegata TaxID=167791 RepID=A0ACB9PPG0_BAUVA|nr:hypothetical protein L6164_004797 [Bauhinia variegata]